MKNVNNNVWIISDGRIINLDLSSITSEQISGPATEYRISEIARYLLNPAPIKLEEKVVGCKVHYKVPPSGMMKRFMDILTFKKDDPSKNAADFTEDILSTSKLDPPSFDDDALNLHLSRIMEQLKPFNPVQKKLAALDRDRVREITATCEDIGRNRYQINLQGSVNEKTNFILKSLTKKAKITIKKAYLLNGLFDFRGYLFESFNTDNAYHLIRLSRNNQYKYCVLTRDYKFDFWVDDNMLISYLHLFEQSIQTDPKLKEALNLCIQGEAKPLKLFFSKQSEQSYSEKHLPMVYRKMLITHNIAPNEMEMITDTLNDNQSIVFFNYVPVTGPGQQKLFTNISVMHDLKALDSIKDRVPHVYSEIIKKTTDSDAGRLYLLDSMRGYQNV
ncbi:MAG: hypothetical protein JSW20_13050 [Nitrospiraceae bacterium]|nr:MAG: hypothetical protein JSW20_13050 [Nitrospiraceae bacterium]